MTRSQDYGLGVEPAFDDWAAWSTDQAERPRSTHPAVQIERETEHRSGDGTGSGSGAPEPSAKQVDYLVSLIGQASADAVRFTRAAYSAAIDAAAPDKSARKPNRYAGKCGRCGQRVDADAGLLTGTAGSWGVEHTGECPDTEPETPPEPVPEGTHRADGAIYRVQRARGSGRLYAKRLTTDDGPEWQYAPGALRGLSADTLLTLAEAKSWGVLTGICAVCGRTLTNEISVAAGIGPVCAARF